MYANMVDICYSDNDNTMFKNNNLNYYSVIIMF